MTAGLHSVNTAAADLALIAARRPREPTRLDVDVICRRRLKASLPASKIQY